MAEIKTISLPMHTLFAELVERCSLAEFDRDFPANGAFVQRQRNSRVYWYFNHYDGTKVVSKYVGPDSDALRQRIARHGKIKQDHNERRQMVMALRHAGLPSPAPVIGELLEALSGAGVFRLRGCLIGTIAYQSYAGLLGVRLPEAQLATGDLDLAQFLSISALVEDSTPPMLEILKTVDETFRQIPYAHDATKSMAFINDQKFRVEFLVPNRGSDDFNDQPVRLPALGGADAQPIRFLDFLIYRAVPNVVLFGSGIVVNVPSPERYAIHKLIVATRRKEGAAKIRKDVAQAEFLIAFLAKNRRHDLVDAWREANDRGPKWKRALADGVAMLSHDAQAQLQTALTKAGLSMELGEGQEGTGKPDIQ